MKSSILFFLQYYLKKHIGFLWCASIDARDIFWKNFYRLKSSMPIKVLETIPKHLLLQTTVDQHEITCYVRQSPSSDLYVFRQIFEYREYTPMVNHIAQYQPADAIKLIVDAGANVGYTTIFLKKYFTQAQVVAIEPDNANAAQISLNLTANNIRDTSIVLAGVWPHDAWLELKKDKSKGEDWGFYVTESETPTDLKAVDILQLPQVRHAGIIDILKIDIEGSEAKLFEDVNKIAQLLSITKFLAVEIHDDIANRQHIQQVLKSNNFTWFETGELTIATNQQLIKN